MRYLIDTNIVSEVMKPAPAPEVAAWIDEHQDDAALSVMVLAELADGVEALADGKKKAALRRKLDFLKEDYADQILVFDEACAWEWARYCHDARTAGFSPPVLDSLIGATARAWGLKVVTRNDSDFPLIDVVNPFNA